MELRKRLFAVLMSLTMVLAYTPAIAFADEYIEPSDYQFEADDTALYSDGEKVFSINDSEAGVPADGSVDVTAGIYREGETEWAKEFTEGKEFTFDADSLTVTLNGEEICKTLQENNLDIESGDISISADAYDGDGNNIWYASGYCSYKEAYAEYDMNADETITVNQAISIYDSAIVYNSEFPEGTQKTYEINEVTSDDASVIQVENYDGNLSCNAVKEGNATITVVYTDLDGATEQYSFKVKVVNYLTFGSEETVVYNDAESIGAELTVSNLGNNWTSDYKVDIKITTYDPKKEESVEVPKSKYSVKQNSNKVAITLDKSLYAEYPEETGLNYDIEASLRTKATDEELQSVWHIISIRKAEIEYDLPEDTECIRGESGGFDNGVNVFEFGTKYPDGKESFCELTDVKILSGADCLDNGLVYSAKADWWSYKTIKTGTVKFQLTYKDIDGKTQTHTFKAEILNDRYAVYIERSTDYTVLPGTTVNLTASGYREYIDSKGNYAEDPAGLTYKWKLEAENNVAELKADGTKGTLKLKESNDPEYDKYVNVQVELYKDGKQVAYDEASINACSDFFTLYPEDVDELEVGETTPKIKPELRHYSIGINNKDKYEVTDKSFRFVFDPKDFEVVSGGKKLNNGDIGSEFTVKRLRSQAETLQLRALSNDYDSFYYFGDQYLHVFYPDEKVTVPGSGNLKVALNTDYLSENWEDYYDIVYTVQSGKWEGKNNRTRTWKADKTFKAGTDYIAKGSTIELIGSKLSGQTGEIRVNAEVKSKFSSEVVGSDYFMCTVSSKSPLSVKNLWASQHSVGKVLFKWSKKDGVTADGWNLKYRFRKIGGNNKWSGWTTKSYSASTYEAWIPIKTDYVIEIHAQAKGDTTWSTGIITCPAGGKYHAMKTTHVINADTKKRLAEKKVGSSAIYHTTINLKVGKTLKVKPEYDYDPKIKDFKKRPKLYPQHLLYDIGDKSMITITKPDGSTYTGGIIDGTATIKATKAGKTTIIFRSPNGRTMIGDVTITN